MPATLPGGSGADSIVIFSRDGRLLPITPVVYELTVPSPADTTEATIGGVPGVGLYRSFSLTANISAKGTGGTLDVYVQGTPDGGTTWHDVIRFSQLASGATAVYEVTLSRGDGATTIKALDSDGHLSSAGNVVGDWGTDLRIRAKAGAGVQLGAEQFFKFAFQR